MNNMLNALHLPLTPPMDLNSHLPGIDKISPFPLQLRTGGSKGLFGSRRDATPDGQPNENWLLRLHEGIDFLAPKGTKVFASAAGTVSFANAEGVTILHDYGIRFFTNYSHLLNVQVSVGQVVKPGELIGEVNTNTKWPNETHLHFEVRLPFDYALPEYSKSLPIDPTLAMYHWEVKSYQNDSAVRNVIDLVHIASFEEVVRGRQLRFNLMKLEGNQRDLFIPLQTGISGEESLAETLRAAFLAKRKVRIVWRESLFFSKIQTAFEKVAIIAEVKVYA